MLEGPRQNLQLVSLEVVDFEVCLGFLSIWRGLPLFNFNKFDAICICAGVAEQCSTTPLVGLLESTVLTCFSSSPMSGSSCCFFLPGAILASTVSVYCHCFISFTTEEMGTCYLPVAVSSFVGINDFYFQRARQLNNSANQRNILSGYL